MMSAMFFLGFGLAGAQPPEMILMHLAPLRETPKESVFVQQSYVPFENLHGVLVVQATVNGETGNYILDTGAPGLVLNRRPQGEGATAGGGVTGPMEIGDIRVESFRWGQLDFSDLHAYTVDLSHLESLVGCKVDGLIGFALLQDNEVFFDLEGGRIAIFSGRNNRLHDWAKPRMTVPFSLSNHMPVVRVEAGREPIWLGIDSGASANLLDISYASLEGSRQTGSSRMINGVGAPQIQASALAVDFSEGYLEEMEYLLMDLSHLRQEYDVRVDGLLGTPFLMQGKVSIHYGKRRLYFW